jgi:hypothetical protein
MAQLPPQPITLLNSTNTPTALKSPSSPVPPLEQHSSTSSSGESTTVQGNNSDRSLVSSCLAMPSTSSGEDAAILDQMARFGVPLHSWQQVVGPLLERTMITCLDDFRHGRHLSTSGTSEDEAQYAIRKNELCDLLHQLSNAPFTLQRVCEIIQCPDAHYKSIDALSKGFEVLLSVTTTIPVASEHDVTRLQREYERVIASSLPGSSSGTPLRRTDTVEMEVDS